MEIKVLDEKPRKFWTAIFVSVITLMAVISIVVMNFRYDSLARYPYRDQRSREIIKQYLNEEEIAYIIEYSIPPNMFIAFIDQPGFNIYHASEYKQVSNVFWDKTPGEIVKIVEETRNLTDTATVIYYLGNGGYDYNSLYLYLTNEDGYATDTNLVFKADALYAYVGNGNTLSSYKPKLVSAPSDIVSVRGVKVAEQTAIGLTNLCSGITSSIENEYACSGLVVTSGYVSYQEQKQAFEDGETSIKPGQSEKQTGLTVHITVEGLNDSDFYKTPQYQWLINHAVEYGFISSEEDPTCYRYVGADLAPYLVSNNISLKEYNDSIQG